MSSRRIGREELFFSVATEYARRATCTRAAVGVVAVRDGRIVAAGYNGSVSGAPHCADVGCEIENDHCIRSVHAEANLVSWSAREGIALKGTQMYITHTPCLACSKLLVNAGVASVNVLTNYGHDGGRELLMERGVLYFAPAS